MSVAEDMFDVIKHLRVQGYSFAQIRINKVLRDLYTEDEIDSTVAYFAAELEDPIELDMMRLDALYKALQDKVKRGDPTAINAGVRILDRRAKLLGLDSPVKIRTEVAGQVNYTIHGVSTAEILGSDKA